MADGDRDSWCTPLEVCELLRLVYPDGVGDPCSNPRSQVPAAWTREQGDRLSYDLDPAPWIGPDGRIGDVFMNHPFSQSPTWVDRAIAEYLAGNVRTVTILSPADRSVSWWRRLWRHAAVICDPDHRLEFIPPPVVGQVTKTGGNDQPNALTLLTDSLAARRSWIKAMRELGPVTTQWRV